MEAVSVGHGRSSAGEARGGRGLLDAAPLAWYLPPTMLSRGEENTAPESGSEYDAFADIYAVWTRTAGSASANLPFYVDAYLEADGPVVELGVGDGRIAVEAAGRGRAVIGVDASAAMLDRCRRRAEDAGVLERLTLQQADFRTFNLDEPAGLVALPYHSIGHLVALDAKRQAMRHIFSRLRPGGRFIFDDFLMTPTLIAQMREVQLRAAYQGTSGEDRLLWVTSLVDERTQSITVVTWEDVLDLVGRAGAPPLSPLEPQLARAEPGARAARGDRFHR